MAEFDFDGLAHANPLALKCKADIRLQPEHFRVEEKLPFSPSGEGGHAMLLIEKTGSNTDWFAKQLAQFAGVDDVAVGYAGLKDRHAVTTQWFTIKLEGHDEPDWSKFSVDNCRIISISRHNKKLKRGALSGNHFNLVLTELQGDMASWLQSLESIKTQGVPNYFAEQRFGHNAGNLFKAQSWFESGKKPKKRQQRSMILSAARSWLFNLVLSERVRQNNWQKWLAGDAMQLNGSHSVFVPDGADNDINARLKEFDIHPTGPLWGRGKPLIQDDSQLLEQQVLNDWQSWTQGLEQAGLKQERRSLRLLPEAMTWQFDHNTLSLSFSLPAGCYATAVLRELAVISDASRRNSINAAVSQ